ncbi:hypothetical protein HHK36_018372 [Tetracentron sinense]|uniref:Inositol polyphosphate-related phosphatase domain-containing protein n=1 Tax=Tetracentron sinense TaxID=13715 RepID=A0A834Z4C3_TETSI|nr:hypothetical protein HHK36_018372 [Tetracentron sinense]
MINWDPLFDAHPKKNNQTKKGIVDSCPIEIRRLRIARAMIGVGINQPEVGGGRAEMRSERVKNSKSSWPKVVVRKWLNIKSRSDEFHSDYAVRAMAGFSERRKSCSDEDHSFVLPKEGWLMEAPDSLKRPRFEPETPADNLNLRMFVGTWNVGGKSPHEGLNLTDLLRTPAPADIYVLGFQEIVPLNAGNVLGAEDYGPAAKWLSLIRQALNSNAMDPEFEQYNSNATNAEWEQTSPAQLDQQLNLKPRISISDLLSLENDQLQQEDFARIMNFNWSDKDSLSQHCLSRRRTSRFCLAASKQMVGIFLCVWVRADLNRHISNLKVSCVGRGIMGYLGNKGSISISMTLQQTTFCFVCTHLTSGEKDGDEVRRNSDVMEILKKTRFPQSRRVPGQPFSPDNILEHDKIIWLGDLNYRLASGCTDVQDLLKKNDWEALLEKDQLRIEQRAGRVFQGWEEGSIYFAPTYKYLANSDHYVVQTSKSKEKQRTPAWCDRILWRGKGLKQISYVRGESRFSDHRPVYSLFSVQVDMADKNKVRRSNPTSTKSNCKNFSTKTMTSTLSSSCLARVQAEELLLARTHSCIETASRF